MKRRDFIRNGVIVAPLSLHLLVNSACSTAQRSEGTDDRLSRFPASGNLRVRPDASSADAKPHLESYAKAVALMRQQPQKVGSVLNGLNWANQANVHLNHCPHGTWFFFPWHRDYLMRFEAIIQKLSGNPDFCLPYWDWTNNPDIPRAFKAMRDPTLGALALTDGTKIDGSRTHDISPQIKRVTNADICNKILSGTDFETFIGSPNAAGQPESGPHNGVHVAVGAFGGPMGAFKSPLDPVFWAHHCNVDRLWAEWQEKNPQWRDAAQIGKVDNGSAWLQEKLVGFYDTDGKPTTTIKTPVDMLDTQKLGYAYPTTAGRDAAKPPTVTAAISTGRRPASGTGSVAHHHAVAFTRDALSVKMTWTDNAQTQAEVQFPPLEGKNIDDYLNNFVKSPDDQYVFRLKVDNCPAIPDGAIMEINYIVPAHGSIEESTEFLANYNFFLPSADEMKHSAHIRMMHSSEYVPGFNLDFTRLLRTLHDKGFDAYPEELRFKLAFFDPKNNQPLSIGKQDFSKLSLKLVVVE